MEKWASRGGARRPGAPTGEEVRTLSQRKGQLTNSAGYFDRSKPAHVPLLPPRDAVIVLQAIDVATCLIALAVKSVALRP